LFNMTARLHQCILQQIAYLTQAVITTYYVW
jgi:hypothetical protein